MVAYGAILVGFTAMLGFLLFRMLAPQIERQRDLNARGLCRMCEGPLETDSSGGTCNRCAFEASAAP